MPRIRTLKPEHRQHRKVGSLSHRQYRLWVGMICEADDEGRLVADASQLRALIFGYHADVSEADVDTDLAFIASRGLIVTYFAHRVRYCVFPDWPDHQVIDKPKPSRLPPPSVHSMSRRPRRSVSDSSPMSRGGSEGIKDRIKDQGSEGIGSEGKGSPREGKPQPERLLSQSEPNGNDPAHDQATADALQRFRAEWATRHPEEPQP